MLTVAMMANRSGSLALLLAALLCAGSGVRAADNDAAIVTRERALADAHTVEQIMKFYAPGEDTVVYDAIAPGLLRGKKAIAQNFADQLAQIRSVKIEIQELSVGGDSTIAYAFSLQHAAITKLDGSSTEVSYRQTDVWRKRHGDWYIVHQQTSYPADLKTGSALFNSQ